jgi:hypothetical protein
VLWRQGNHPAPPGRPQGHPDHCSRVTPRDRRDARPPSPTVPERRRTAGSGPAAAVPTMLGVSISQHCPGRRLDPTWEPWPSSERSTGPATPSTPCSIRSSPSTWKPSWARRRRPATGRASRSSSSASSDDINLEMSEFTGKGSGTIAAALSRPPFDDDILAFDVSLIP